MVTIVLFTSSHWFSKIIQFVLGSKIGHAAIGFEKDGKQFFLHAAWGGVQISTKESVMSNHSIVAEFEILPDMSDELALAETKVGKPYDTVGLLGYLAVLFAKKFGIGLHNPLASKSAVVCSEFVMELDVNNEIPEFNGLTPSDITPKDLFHICSSGKSFKLIT